MALGLGANLSPRRERLRRAAKRLVSLLDGARFSTVYETEPVHVTSQPRFLNACCIGRTRLAPGALLEELKRLEGAAGRPATRSRYGPRELDLDILLYGQEVVMSTGLVIPHPRLAERGFVLVPLAELAPAWRHPVLDRTVSELLAGVDTGGVEPTTIELLPGEEGER